LIKNKNFVSVLNLADENDKETFLKVKNLGFSNQELIFLNPCFFSYIEEPTYREQHYAIERLWCNLFSIKNFNIFHVQAAITFSEESSWSDYFIERLFNEIEPSQHKNIIKMAPFLYFKMKKEDLELALIAIENKPQFFKQIKSVPNPDFQSTVSNLKEKMNILRMISE
jgi:hypothetical protein